MTHYNFEAYTINPNQFNVFYRLRQVDFDGTEDLSPVRLVRFDQEVTNTSWVKLYPNPTQDNVQVQVSVGDEFTRHQLTVTDQMGRTLVQSTFDGARTTVPMADYSTGIYFITVDGQSIKVIKR